MRNGQSRLSADYAEGMVKQGEADSANRKKNHPIQLSAEHKEFDAKLVELHSVYLKKAGKINNALCIIAAICAGLGMIIMTTRLSRLEVNVAFLAITAVLSAISSKYGKHAKRKLDGMLERMLQQSLVFVMRAVLEKKRDGMLEQTISESVGVSGFKQKSDETGIGAKIDAVSIANRKSKRDRAGKHNESVKTQEKTNGFKKRIAKTH